MGLFDKLRRKYFSKTEDPEGEPKESARPDNSPKTNSSASANPNEPAAGRSKPAAKPKVASNKAHGHGGPKKTPESRKRKTLPKDFDAIVASGDIESIKAVFDRCQLEAYGGYTRETALAHSGMPEDAIRWLVAQGANVNARDLYGKSPLHKASSRWNEPVELFIELGADIEATDRNEDTPLFCAASRGNVFAVERLIAHGAKTNLRNKAGRNPLEEALSQCRNADIVRTAAVAEILLASGVPITQAMKDFVERIGTAFEFHRQDFAKEHIEKTDAALAHLYAAFDVAPIPKRRVHDGISPIAASDNPWQKQHAELWDYLVPGSGHAATAQGEAIRITGKIAHEVLGNGSVNWDADFRKMLATLLELFRSGTPLPDSELEEATALAESLGNGTGSHAPDRLSELAVHWVLVNPDPLPQDKPTYKR